MTLAVTLMLLHRPRALIMPSFRGRACPGTARCLVGYWTYGNPWAPPPADNENSAEVAWWLE